MATPTSKTPVASMPKEEGDFYNPIYRNEGPYTFDLPTNSPGPVASMPMPGPVSANGGGQTLRNPGTPRTFGAGGSALGGLQSLDPAVASAGAQVDYPDTTAAKNAAFARAKDQTGLNARASLTALQDQLGGNQMLGSGLAADQSRRIIEHGEGQLDEVSRAQSINDANAIDKRAATEYQGRIQQRGQDISVAQANAQRQQQVLEALYSAFGNGIVY